MLAHAHERDVVNAHVCDDVQVAEMALNRLMGLGVGLAVAGAVVKSTLYNGMLSEQWKGYRLAYSRQRCIQAGRVVYNHTTLVYHAVGWQTRQQRLLCAMRNSFPTCRRVS